MGVFMLYINSNKSICMMSQNETEMDILIDDMPWTGMTSEAYLLARLALSEAFFWIL